MKGITPRVPVALGFLCVLVPIYQTSHWTFDVSQFEILWTGFVQGIGVGLISMPSYTIAFISLPPRLRTDGSGLLNLSRMVGSSVSISIVTSLLARNVQINHASLATYIHSSTLEALQPPLVRSIPEVAGVALRMADAEINRQATMIAFMNDFRLIFWMTLATMPLLFLIGRSAPPQLAPQPASPPPSPPEAG